MLLSLDILNSKAIKEREDAVGLVEIVVNCRCQLNVIISERQLNLLTNIHQIPGIHDIFNEVPWRT